MRKKDCKQQCHIEKEDPCWGHKCACAEDHTHVENVYTYTTTVTCLSPFNMPDVDGKLVLKFDKLQSILPGAILWNGNVGFLHVASFDETTSEVTVYNKDEVGNKPIGAAVLANEKFHIGIPKVGVDETEDFSNIPMLAADFIAPSGTTTVAVTSINGLRESEEVSIQGYIFNLKTIVDRNTIVLEYVEGKSAVPGQVIEFDPNKCSTPSVAVVPYAANPCDAGSITEGKIIACSDNLLAPIEGEADGQLLVWDNQKDKWVLKNNNFQEMCSSLTKCLIIDTTEVSDDDDETEDITYLTYVTKTSVFSVGNKVNIGGTTFIIREIVDDEKMRITPEETPSAPLSFNRGASVCIEECCTWVPKKLDDTVDSKTWRPKSLQTIGAAYIYESHKGADDLQGIQLQLGTGNVQKITVQQDGATIFNEDEHSKMTVSCRCYGILKGFIKPINTTPDFSKRLVLATRLYIIRINPDGTQEIANNNEVGMRHSFFLNNFDKEQAGAEHLCYSDEVLYEVPEYDPNNPDNSKATFSAKWEVEILSLSDNDAIFAFGGTDATGYMSVKIVTEGIRQ